MSRNHNFDIKKYIGESSYNNFFTKFKIMIYNNDNLNSGDLIHNQLTNFRTYLDDNYTPPDFGLKSFEKQTLKIDEYNKELQKNAKYIYFLANLLTYAFHIYNDKNKKIEERIKLLRNISQYLSNFEQNAFTGIYFMNDGINYTDYNNQFSSDTTFTPNFLFTKKFIKAYYETLFIPKLKNIFDEFLDDEYIKKTGFKHKKDISDFNVASNSLFNDIIVKFIGKLEQLQLTEEPQIKKQRLTVGGQNRRLLKKYII